jgi:hypothetical protein
MPYRLALFVILLAAALPGLTRAQEASPTPFTGETYVGVTADGQIAVAVVIGGNGEDAEVRAYLCDGVRQNTWLTGSRNGDALDLSAESGAAIFATRGEQTVTGTILSPDGRPLPFIAGRATGPAGLFDVTLAEDGGIQGMSAEGRRLVGRVAMELADGSRLIAALIEQSDDRVRAVAAIASADAAGEQRWIVQTDGSITGGFKPDLGAGFTLGAGSARIIDGTSNT